MPLLPDSLLMKHRNIQIKQFTQAIQTHELVSMLDESEFLSSHEVPQRGQRALATVPPMAQLVSLM